jgi:hypothetical protein
LQKIRDALIGRKKINPRIPHWGVYRRENMEKKEQKKRVM